MILYILLSILVIFFEVSLRDINILSDVSFLFIVIGLLFWQRRYKAALVCGFICAFFVDLILQDHLGKTVFSLFGPLCVLTFFDNLLRVESGLSREIYLVVSVATSIFICDFLFDLVFLESEFFISLVIKRIFLSVIVSLLFSLIFGRFLHFEEGKTGKYL